MTLPKGTNGPVQMDTPDVVKLSEALTADAVRFNSDTAKLLAKFQPANNGQRVYGQDPTITSAGHAMNRHDAALKAAKDLIESINKGYASISRATRAVVTEFKNQDGVNAASVADVRKSMNLSEAPPQRPRRRTGGMRAV